jgi:hypothetical protein
MVQYILECIAFQLAFLVIYDFFLKKETFFQWNRVYLIGTYVLSLVLPWVKIEALKTTVSENYYVYPEFLLGSDTAVVVANTETTSFINLSWQEGVFYGGMLIAAVYFGYKLFQLYKLSKNGSVEKFPNFTRVVITNSELAFSFFRSIFLGDKILNREHGSIIKHELVHIEQRHTVDLLFFELMRIVGWFNPLVYVYQNRIAELHEFIADAQVPKKERKAHYDLLLSQIFNTQNISFVNHFFKSSLIKKRIVMLQKSKSKKIFQLKYLLLIPMMFGMLAYSSLEKQEFEEEKTVALHEIVVVGYLDKNSNQKHEIITRVLESSFEEVTDIPVFSGCENANDKGICFEERMQQHIKSNMTYPKQAFVNNEEGRFNMIFILDKNGKISKVRSRMTGDSSESIEKEAIRWIASMPTIDVSKMNESLENILFSLPITFRLSDESRTEVVTTTVDSEKVAFSVVDEIPMFPGCENAEDKRVCFNQMIQKHIAENFQYPEEAQEKDIQGRVNIMFTIGKDGIIKGLKMRGPDKLLEGEAKRIIGLLPAMKPGKHEGNSVDVPYSIPITFKLKTTSVTTETNQLTEKYNSIVAERKRLLRSTDEANPIIKNLDAQLAVLKEDIQESLGSLEYKGSIDKTGKLTSKYNSLVAERKRLLQSKDENNPVIKNLDEELSILKEDMQQSLNKDIVIVENESKNYDGLLDVPFSVVDEIPIFPGCENVDDKRSCFNLSIQKHISKNLEMILGLHPVFSR